MYIFQHCFSFLHSSFTSCCLQQILERLNKMCSSGVWKKQQRLLKNMGAHKVMLDLLQVSYDQVRPLPAKVKTIKCV